uniref:Protein translocase subunit SecA n=1 Tax=Lygus hesperus TaxID=30085 RepID=A0A0A9XMT3_LYGHE
MSDVDSGSDSDDLIWDFGKPNIPEDLKEKFIKMKEHKPKKRKSENLWPSPHSVKLALDKACLNKPEPLLEVQDEPLEAFRSHFKLFRERLNQIAQEHTTIDTEENPSKKIKSSDVTSSSHQEVEAKCDVSILYDSIDDASLALCSQLVEDKFVNDSNTYSNLPDSRRAISSSSTAAINPRVVERIPGAAPSILHPTVSQPSKPSNLLDDDDDDLFLNETLLSY